MADYPDEAWQRLGRLLLQRRPQLDARYRIRKVFAAERGLTDKSVQDVENAYRKNFSDEIISAFETAYQWSPGSIDRVLSGGDPEPVNERTSSRFEIIDGGGGSEARNDDYEDESDETMIANFEAGIFRDPSERIMWALDLPVEPRLSAIRGKRRGQFESARHQQQQERPRRNHGG